MWLEPGVSAALQRLRNRSLLIPLVVIILLAGALSTVAGTILGLVNFQDVDYPDSATLLRIGDALRSGHLYPEINKPPYLVTIYGPLTYILMAIPYNFALLLGMTPQVLVRLGIIAALCVGLLLTFMIGKGLYESRRIAGVCTLFAVAIFPLSTWTTQIRGDFFGLAAALLGLYIFLFANVRRKIMFAAIVCGIALLVKQTFLAMPLAVAIWLVHRHRYKECVRWVTGVAVTVALGYGLMLWREPRMLAHVAILRHPVLEYRVAFDILVNALSQPLAPFAAVGFFLALRTRNPNRLLLVIYCLVSWLLAIITIPQVGGNINYFWEPLFTAALLAGPALYELQPRVHRIPIVVSGMIGLLLVRSFLPLLHEEFVFLKLCYSNAISFALHKKNWESLSSMVSGRRVLSTSADITIQSVVPEIPDPYLNSVLESRGLWNSSSIVAQINAQVYDFIIVWRGEPETNGRIYRGIRFWDSSMWGALKTAYRPACEFEGREIWLPIPDKSENMAKLLAIGCLVPPKPVKPGSGGGATLP